MKGGFIGGKEKARKFFEDNLKISFQEIRRVLKPNGIVIIVYAHKSTEGWESVINALLDSSLIITGAWPISTEMQKSFAALGIVLGTHPILGAWTSIAGSQIPCKAGNIRDGMAV